jgi:hypothetical protein
MRLPHESLHELHEESRAWELLAPWDVRPDNARLERNAVYTFSARYADQWRAGRVLLAGDAAHLMPPFAGQGMCSGLRDAANLAWKLAFVLDGVAGDQLLDSYQSERLPSAMAAIRFSVDLGKVICVPDPAEAAARDAAMAADVDGTGAPPGLPSIDDGFVHPSSPHAGIQLVQGKIDGRPFDQVHGNGWRLVANRPDAEPVAAHERAWFESIGGKVVVLDQPDPWFDRWFTEHHTTYALQRPDFYVYGTATTPTSAEALLADLRHHLVKDTTQ